MHLDTPTKNVEELQRNLMKYPINAGPKYDLFRSNNQHIYKNKFETYYIRGHIKHYNKKPVDNTINNLLQ